MNAPSTLGVYFIFIEKNFLHVVYISTVISTAKWVVQPSLSSISTEPRTKNSIVQTLLKIVTQNQYM